MQCISQMWFSIFDTSYSDDAKTLKTIALRLIPNCQWVHALTPPFMSPDQSEDLHLCSLKHQGY